MQIDWSLYGKGHGREGLPINSCIKQLWLDQSSIKFENRIARIVWDGVFLCACEKDHLICDRLCESTYDHISKFHNQFICYDALWYDMIYNMDYHAMGMQRWYDKWYEEWLMGRMWGSQGLHSRGRNPPLRRWRFVGSYGASQFYT